MYGMKIVIMTPIGPVERWRDVDICDGCSAHDEGWRCKAWPHAGELAAYATANIIHPRNHKRLDLVHANVALPQCMRALFAALEEEAEESCPTCGGEPGTTKLALAAESGKEPSCTE